MTGSMAPAGFPIRWAILGKHDGQYEEYAILADDSAGPRRPEYRSRIASLLVNDPTEAPPGAVDALPWVYVSPFDAEGARRLAVTVTNWPDPPVRDGFKRPVAFTHYYDVDLADLRHRGAGYADLYETVTSAARTDGGVARRDPPTTDVANLARHIDGVGFHKLLAVAALLIDGPVAVSPRNNLPTSLSGRLWFLDAITALLPYGLRGDLALGTWSPSPGRHQLRLTLSDSSAEGWRTVFWGTPAPPPVGSVARDYVDRLAHLQARWGTAEVVARLWLDKGDHFFSRPETLLDSLTSIDPAYIVRQNLRLGRATVSDVVAVVGHKETNLSLADPEVIADLATEIAQKAPEQSLNVLGRLWPFPSGKDATVACAVATESLQRVMAIYHAVREPAPYSFLAAVAVAARSDDECRRVAAFLAVTESLDPAPLRTFLLKNPMLTARLLVAAYSRAPRIGRSWSDMLFRRGGDEPLPLWAQPFPAMLAGQATMSSEQFPKGYPWMPLALMATVFDAGQASAFLSTTNAWISIFSQLVKGMPDYATQFRAIPVPSLGAHDQAAYDLLQIANGDAPTLPPALRYGVTDDYYEGLRRWYSVMNPDKVRPQALALARRTLVGLLDRPRAKFLIDVADLLPVSVSDARNDVLRSLAEAALDNPDAIAEVSPQLLTKLVELVPELGHRFLRRRLSDAAATGAKWDDLSELAREALLRGMRVSDVLIAIQRWPELDDSLNAYRFICELSVDVLANDSAPIDSVAREGLEFLLAGGYGINHGIRLANWIRDYVKVRKEALDALDQLVRKTRPARSRRSGGQEPPREVRR